MQDGSRSPQGCCSSVEGVARHVRLWEVERGNVRSHLPCEGVQKRAVWGSFRPSMGLGGRDEVSLP